MYCETEKKLKALSDYNRLWIEYSLNYRDKFTRSLLEPVLAQVSMEKLPKSYAKKCMR